VADVFGAPASMILAGCVVLAIVAGIGLFYAPYRRIGWALSTPTAD
jgi:hypothetical protein